MNKQTVFSIIIAVIVLILTNVSVLLPVIMPLDHLVFLGRRTINSQDVYTYVSFIEQSRQGAFLFKNLYTSEPQTPSLLRPSYLVIGKIAAVTGMSSIVAYHAARIVLSGIFFGVLFLFLTHFFTDKQKRLAAFALITTASGIGFLISQWVPNSIDLWVPEAIPFLTLFEAPHFILSLILLLTGFHFFLNYLKDNKANSLIWVSVAFLFLSFEHPFDLGVIVPTLFITALWNKLPIKKALTVSILGGIGLLYQVFAVITNPILGSWQIQNVLPSPQPISYITGFGLLLPFALVGLEVFLNEQKREQTLVVSWICVTALLLYAPVGIQRRFIEAAQIPLSIAALYGMYTIFGRYKPKTKTIAIYTTIAILSLSSLFMVNEDMKQIQTDSTDSYYYHLSREEFDAIIWLGRQTDSRDVILSNWFFGNLIPGLTGRTVYIGHKIQTIDFDKKIENINRFLRETDNTKAVSFLKQNGITYLYFGAGDTMLTYGFKPETKPFLTKVYAQGAASIYKVN